MQTVSPPNIYMLRLASVLFWVSLFIISTGCASRTAYVVARQDPQFNISANSKICLANHAQPRKSELDLLRDLEIALQELGITLVPSDQAEFTLTYWLDDSWKVGKKIEYYYNGAWQDTDPMTHGTRYHETSGGPYGAPLYQEFTSAPKRVVDSPYYIQGIRLKIYPKSSAGGVHYQTTWEGYIEGGNRVSQSREPVLLRTLLNYFGKDFNGHAPLAR